MEFNKEKFKKDYFEGKIDVIDEEFLEQNDDMGEWKNIVFKIEGKLYQLEIYIEYGAWCAGCISIDRLSIPIEVEAKEILKTVYVPKNDM